MPRDTLRRVLEVIRQDVSAEKVRIDTPTQNLESYFLGVVQKARESEAETSGATSGSKIAAYLRGDAEAASPAEKILERLTQPAPSPAPTVSPESKETIDASKLDELARPTKTTPEKPASVAEPVDLEKANEKLSSLLGKPK